MSLKINRLKFNKSDIKQIFNFIKKYDKISFYGAESFQKEYEEELAKYFSKNHCLLTNSGTNALFSAYFALGLSEGDEVIAQTNTFWATITPLLHFKAIPVLIDSEIETGNMDASKIEQAITSKTKAIVVTPLFGYSPDMDKICQIVKKYNLKLVEDISISFGAKYNNKLLGTFGDIACFSLGSTKMLSGGQGGGLVTSNREYYERAIMLGYFGERSLNEVMDPFYRQFRDIGYGMNNRMHVLSLAVSRGKFKQFNKLINMRKKRYNLLKSYVKKIPFLEIPKVNYKSELGAWHGFYVNYKENKAKIKVADFVKNLTDHGLEIKLGSHYPLLHTTKLFQTKQDGFYRLKENENKKIYSNGDFPVAENFNKTHIFFPLFLDESLSLVTKYGKILLNSSKLNKKENSQIGFH